jgi:RNA polymerase sigma-70 factor (ECF subfamily)
MNDSQPSNGPFNKEPRPTDIADVKASPVGLPEDAAREAFIVSAYEEHQAALFAFLARSTRQRSLAEDLLQETYRRLTREAGDEHATLEVRRRLFRVASNLVIERSKGQPTALCRPDRPGRKEHRIGSSPEARTPSSEPPTEMDRALEGLSVDARVALLLSGEGFTGEEIAAAISRSPSAARTLLGLARARVRVRRQLIAAAGR